VTAGFGHFSYQTAWVLTFVALAVACGAVLVVRRMLPGFPVGVLRADSARAGRTRLAVTFLNVPLLTWVAEDNRWRGQLLTSRPWPQLPPAWALAWADWRRLARRPAPLVVLAASTLAPALVGVAITGHARGLTIAATVLAGAMAAGAQGTAALRRDANDPTLRRLLGVAARPELAARAALPVLLGAAWLTLAGLVLVLAGVLTGWLWPALGLVAGPGAAVSAPPWLVTRALSVLLGVAGCYPVLKAVRAGHADGGTLVAQVVLSAVVLGGYIQFASGS